jgi:hypothetical protein
LPTRDWSFVCQSNKMEFGTVLRKLALLVKLILLGKVV